MSIEGKVKYGALFFSFEEIEGTCLVHIARVIVISDSKGIVIPEIGAIKSGIGVDTVLCSKWQGHVRRIGCIKTAVEHSLDVIAIQFILQDSHPDHIFM